MIISSIPASILYAASMFSTSPPQIEGSYRSLVDMSQIALEEGRYEDAIDAIDAAQSKLESPAPELVYNRAVANYRLGDWSSAASDFTKAIELSDDPNLLSDSVYNLGNVTHSEVLESLQQGDAQDAQQAIDQLETARDALGDALDHYRSAIRTGNDDEDARANAELTWNLMNQLQQMQEQLEEQQQQQDQQQQDQQQDQQQQEQQQQDQQQQDQQQQEQQQQQQDQQQQEQQQQEQQQDQQQQDQQQQQQQQQQDQQQQEQQQQQQQQDQQQQQQDQQQQEQQQEQDEQQKLEEALEKLEQSMKQLEQAIDQREQQLEQDPQDSKAKAELDELETLKDQMEKMKQELEAGLQQEQTDEDSQEEPEESQEIDGRNADEPMDQPDQDRPDTMTREEAQRLLQAVRDKERLRRLEQIQREREGTPATGKDW